MKIAMADGLRFKDAISVLSDLIQEGEFSVSADGVKFSALDAANVGMATLHLKPTMMGISVGSEAEKFAVNLKNLKDLMKRGNRGDEFELSLENNLVTIKFKGKMNKKFTLPTLEFDGKTPGTPSFPVETNVVLDSDEFKKSVEDIGIVSESTYIIGMKDKLMLKGGEDGNDCLVELSPESIVQEVDSVKSKFSIEYLKKMAVTSVSQNVYMSFGKDSPLKLEFKSDDFDLTFILAPRIENL